MRKFPTKVLIFTKIIHIDKDLIYTIYKQILSEYVSEYDSISSGSF